MTTTADRPFLAADVGGTHARLGLVSTRPGPSPVTLLARHTYACAEYPSLLDIIRTFLREYDGDAVQRGVLACAGYAVDDVVINTNLAWNVDVHVLRNSLHLDDLVVINDFEAVAYATQYVDPATTIELTSPTKPAAGGPQVVVGPGTGLGSAVLLRSAQRPTVLATEAGQAALAPGNALEADILSVLAQTDPYVSYERVLSGPGLVNIYDALCSLESVTPRLASPEALTAAALADADVAAQRTLNVFCALLGSFAGDLAMLYGASGGVWLAGSILPEIREFLAHSAFVDRFLNKGRMRVFLERIPVRLMEHGQLGVTGAARWYLDQGRPLVHCRAPDQVSVLGNVPETASESDRGV